MIQLSIVIPTLNAASDLAACLAAIGPIADNPIFDVQVIVSDGGSADNTAQIAARAGCQVITGPQGRGAQLRAGAKAATGAWLLFVHADSHLPPGWPTAVANHIAKHPGHAAVFRLAFRAPGLAPKLVAGWANLRSRAGLPYGDQGLLICAGLYDDIGGYPDIALMEDVAIARALRGRLRLLHAVTTTSATRYQRQGWARRGARNLGLLVRYFCGADPKTLARRYAGVSSSGEN